MLFPTFSSLLFLFQNTPSNDNLPHNHIRHQIFHEYFRGTTAAQATRNVNSVYGDGSTSERTCQVWYKRFRDGDIDQSRSGKPNLGYYMISPMPIKRADWPLLLLSSADTTKSLFYHVL
jgi:hypothetical protein